MASDNKTSLMALGSAAVIGVYAAGWFKTKAAADRFAAESEAGERRRPAPSPTEQPRAQTVERVVASPPGGTPVLMRAGAAAATPPLPALTRVADAKTGKPNASAKDDFPPLSPRGSLTQRVIAPQVPVEAAVESVVTAASAPLPGSTPTSAAAAATAPAVIAAAAPVTTPVTAPTPAPQSVVESAPLPAAAKPADQAAHHADPPAPKWKDGTYYGWGTSRHGDIQAAVIIQNGRISQALISQCLTRYSCSWIAALPPQVAIRQSAEVDYVSGATQSTNAFYYAVIEALTRAK